MMKPLSSDQPSSSPAPEVLPETIVLDLAHLVTLQHPTHTLTQPEIERLEKTLVHLAHAANTPLAAQALAANTATSSKY